MFNPIDEQEFLKTYWQKRACFFKSSSPIYPNFLSADELAGFALEQEVESRLVINEPSINKWSLQHGPFSTQQLEALPESNWTLLVQSIDYWYPQIRELLKHFAFIPKWRFDDVMVSFATDKGGVGPHADNYDVFLIQGNGKRRWRVGSKDCLPAQN